MINEITVTSEDEYNEYKVVFRTYSTNDGGQSDRVSEPTYFIDGDDYELSTLWDPADINRLKDMFQNHTKYDYTEAQILPHGEDH